MSYEIVKKDDLVFEIDTRGRKFYIILYGSVEVLIRKGVVDSNLTSVKILEKGDYFGEMGLINDQPRLASIRALENSILLVLSKE